MTLGGAAAARVRFIVWCLECRYQTEPDPAEMARRYGPETTVLDWHKRLVERFQIVNMLCFNFSLAGYVVWSGRHGRGEPWLRRDGLLHCRWTRISAGHCRDFSIAHGTGKPSGAGPHHFGLP